MRERERERESLLYLREHAIETSASTTQPAVPIGALWGPFQCARPSAFAHGVEVYFAVRPAMHNVSPNHRLVPGAVQPHGSQALQRWKKSRQKLARCRRTGSAPFRCPRVFLYQTARRRPPPPRTSSPAIGGECCCRVLARGSAMVSVGVCTKTRARQS